MKKVCIIGGCGHVGLPLGLAMASRGFDVSLVDINAKLVELINEGKVPFQESGAEEILSEVLTKGNFRATLDAGVVQGGDIIVFVTGTPVDEHLNPRVNDVLDVVRSYMPYLNPKQLLVLRSTIYPDVFDVVDNILQDTLHEKFKLAFCPERVLQGKGIEEIFSLPQIVSANSSIACDEAAAVFSKIAPKVILLEPEEAALAKLMTNSWRYLQFAIANQFYMLVEEKGYNFYKILGALSEDYPRAKFFAKAGFAAGPCLFKDTRQISAFYNNKFFLGHAGMLINEGLPKFVVNQLEQKLGGLKGKHIALLGMTFKANNDDTRESLSFKVKKLLDFKMAHTYIHDPYLKTESLKDVLKGAEGVILGVPHDEYKDISPKVPYVDCWNLWNSKKME